jgi:hypothetical protein
MKENFDKKPSLPAGILYNRKTGGDDGNMSGNTPEEKQIGVTLDDAGFQTDGYHIKKNTPFQMGSSIGYVDSRPLNRLPPGMFIDNQDVTDIRPLPFKEIVETKGYPGDGWTGSGTDKLGR